MSGGLGHIKDHPHDGDVHVRELVGIGGTIPTFVDLSPYIDHVRNQLGSSSCVGQALTTAAYVRARFMNLPGIAHPSALAAYCVGRAMDRENPAEPLQDVGCRPRMATLGCQQWGFCPEAVWPFDELRVNDDVPLDVLQRSAGHRLTSYYRIDDLGPARSEHMRQALAQGYPVCVAIEVDGSFDSTNGIDFIPPPSGASRGSHYICVLGYRPGAFLVINSWGVEWGRDGYAWLSDARMEDPSTTDIQVTEVVAL